MARISPKKISNYPWYMRLLFHFQNKKYKASLEPALLWGRTPKVFLIFLFMQKALNRRKSPIDPVLRAMITVRVSQINQCAFCIDMNSALFFQRGGLENKLLSLSEFQKSSLFSEKEKAALEYAENITQSSNKIPNELFEKLKKNFDDNAIVELTALIGFQNLSSKFNSALDATAYGFCKKPS